MIDNTEDENLAKNLEKAVELIGNLREKNPAIAMILGCATASIVEGKADELAHYLTYLSARQMMEKGIENGKKIMSGLSENLKDVKKN